MDYKERFVVVGITRWKGSIDGKSIDSAKLYTEVHLDDSRNVADQWKQGVIVEEFSVSPALAQRLHGMPMPVLIEATTRRVATKPGEPSKVQVIDLVPVLAKADSDGVLPLNAGSNAGRKAA